MSAAEMTSLLRDLAAKVGNLPTKADLNIMKTELETKIAESEVRVQRTMATKDDMRTFKADVGRMFEAAIGERIARKYGAPYARSFLANSSYGMVRLSTVKRHDVSGKDGSNLLIGDVKAFAEYVFANRAKLLPPGGLSQKHKKLVGTMKKCKNLANATELLAACSGLAPACAVLLAFGASGTMELAKPHADLAQLCKPAFRTEVEVDCRGDVEENGRSVLIRTGEIKSGAEYLYGVSQVAQSLLLRAFVHWVVRGCTSGQRYALTGTVFVVDSRIRADQASVDAICTDLCSAFTRLHGVTVDLDVRIDRV